MTNGMAKLGPTAAHWYVNSSLNAYAMAGWSMKPTENAICIAQPSPLRYLGPTSSITTQNREHAIKHMHFHEYFKISTCVGNNQLQANISAAGAMLQILFIVWWTQWSCRKTRAILYLGVASFRTVFPASRHVTSRRSPENGNNWLIGVRATV